MATMTKKTAAAIVGTLSKPSKIPGGAWGIPARLCKTGSKLRTVKGSTCEGCYALKGFYRMKGTQNAAMRRLEAFQAVPRTQWVASMATLIVGADEHRWLDGGDIQSPDMLGAFCDVARATPTTKHWIATRELGMVSEYLRDGGEIPENVVIRLSDPMVDGKPIRSRLLDHPRIVASGVTRDAEKATCPAPSQGNACRSCRKCWDADVARVVYLAH